MTLYCIDFDGHLPRTFYIESVSHTEALNNLAHLMGLVVVNLITKADARGVLYVEAILGNGRRYQAFDSRHLKKD